MIASVHDYLVTTTARTVSVHHFSSGQVTATVAATEVVLTVRTDYPFDGTVTIEVDAGAEPATWDLRVRVPAWCPAVEVTVAGQDEPADVVDGYLRIARTWAATTTVRVTFAMPVRLVAAHPHVDAVRGCVAVARGPVLYAVEQADLPDDVVLEDVRLVGVVGAQPAGPPELGPVAVELDVSVAPPATAALYAELAAGRPIEGDRRIRVRALPYHRWGNRDPGGMRVWLPLAAPAAEPE